MATSAQSRPVLRFEEFEVDLRSCELRKRGARLRLQDQPFQVLRMLLENRGEIVGREELKQKLWPADTFVDFDDGLNTAVKKLRDTLGDSTEHPRYIETIPRHGYRFIGTVLPQQPVAERPSLEAGTSPEISVAKPTLRRRKTRLLWIAISLAITFALVVTSALAYRARLQSETASVKSIAVLPLDNLSGDPAQDYFAAGLTDALTTELARTVGNSMRVTSRASAMQYRNKPLAQIAHELDVDAVIEGSVVRSGNRARITAQLINARADKHLWAASYDRDLQDILSLQSEIAATVARQVKITLSPRVQARLTRRQTVDPEAYDLYQRGLFHAFSNNKQDMATAIELLQQAVARDPNLAAAHAVLAREYTNQAFLQQPQDPNLEPKAIQELDEALKLDPDLPVAYLARGVMFWTHRNGFPHERAIVELKRALELDPNLAEAHHELGMIYAHVGLLDKADHEVRTALELEPTSLAFRFRIATILLKEGRLEEARTQLQSTESYSPDQWAHTMTLTLFELGRKQEAAALNRDFLRDNARDPGGLGNGMQALLYADAGERSLAERSIQTAIQKGKSYGHFHHTAYSIGSAYALMNRPKQAVRWLRAAAEDGFPCYPFYEQDAALQNLRNDPGFLELMAEMRNDWERRRATL